MYCHVGELRHIDSRGVIHDSANRRERKGDHSPGELKNIFNVPGLTGRSLTEALVEPIVDHVPTLYAIHIWNNIPEVD
jgi:hypothetical protein